VHTAVLSARSGGTGKGHGDLSRLSELRMRLSFVIKIMEVDSFGSQMIILVQNGQVASLMSFFNARWGMI